MLQLLHERRIKRVILLSDGRTAIVEVRDGLRCLVWPAGAACAVLGVPGAVVGPPWMQA